MNFVLFYPDEMRNRYGDPALADARQALESRLLDWYVHTADVVRFEHPRGLSER